MLYTYALSSRAVRRKPAGNGDRIIRPELIDARRRGTANSQTSHDVFYDVTDTTGAM